MLMDKPSTYSYKRNVLSWPRCTQNQPCSLKRGRETSVSSLIHWPLLWLAKDRFSGACWSVRASVGVRGVCQDGPPTASSICRHPELYCPSSTAPVNLHPGESGQGGIIKTHKFELLDDIQVLLENISLQGLTLKIHHYSFLPYTPTAGSLGRAFFTQRQLLIAIWRIWGLFYDASVKLALSHIALSPWCVCCNNKPWSPADIAALFSSTPSFQKLRLEISHVTPEIHGSETKEQKWVWAFYHESTWLLLCESAWPLPLYW